MAKTFIALGACFTVLGLLLLVFPKGLSWFGNLPGDLRSSNVFFPFTSMLVVSGLLTLILNLVGWLVSRR